jgi:hypothetical protein
MSPDKAVAQRYAGEGGSISEQSIAFRNLLDAPTWVEAKQRLGLKQSDTMETLINKARESGYDGITFKTTNGQEYIHIPASGPAPVPVEASQIPHDIPLPQGFKAVRLLETETARDPNMLAYNVVDPDTGKSAGQIAFMWNPVNRMFQPIWPGVNLHPQAQKKGLYPAFLTELAKHVDIGSTGVSRESGTMPNAERVWRKLGAKEESVVEDEAFSGPKAFVLRRKK